MTNSILFPKEIYKKLTECKEITDITGERIYPILADNKVALPFIVFTKDDIHNKLQTKDGYSTDQIEFTVFIVSDKYAVSLDLANSVRKLFEHPKMSFDDYIVRNCVMSGIRESFEENAYLQVLTFEAEIDNR